MDSHICIFMQDSCIACCFLIRMDHFFFSYLHMDSIKGSQLLINLADYFILLLIANNNNDITNR